MQRLLRGFLPTASISRPMVALILAQRGFDVHGGPVAAVRLVEGAVIGGPSRDT